MHMSNTAGREFHSLGVAFFPEHVGRPLLEHNKMHKSADSSRVPLYVLLSRVSKLEHYKQSNLQSVVIAQILDVLSATPGIYFSLLSTPNLAYVQSSFSRLSDMAKQKWQDLNCK